MVSILDQKLNGYELALLHNLRQKAESDDGPVASLVSRLVEIIEEVTQDTKESTNDRRRTVRSVHN
jgi:hypothetical protein